MCIRDSRIVFTLCQRHLSEQRWKDGPTSSPSRTSALWIWAASLWGWRKLIIRTPESMVVAHEVLRASLTRCDRILMSEDAHREGLLLTHSRSAGYTATAG